MTPKPGFRIRDTWTRPEQQIIDGFRDIPTPNVGDAMNRMGIVGGGVRPVWEGARCVGPALTVWVRAGDNLMLHKAIAMAAPGDVIVVNGQGDTTRALFGELMGGTAADAGIAGLVFDAAVRDVAQLKEMGLPVFAAGVSPAGPFKNGPGEIGRAVACGGVVCRSGDVVVADGDGVAIVPREDAAAVLADARAVFESEATRRSGSAKRAGIDEELIRLGVIERP
jgi:regulator of RNase E activity RraA